MKNLSETSSRTVNRQTKWRFINDTRSTTVSNNNFFGLENSFGEFLFDNQQIVILLNYRFSKLGDYFGKTRPYEKSTRTYNRKTFSFRFVTSKEVLHHLKPLNTKPIGPTEIPAWVLKDGKDVLMHPFTYLFNDFLKGEKFPSDRKKPLLHRFFKKVIGLTLRTTGLYQ